MTAFGIGLGEDRVDAGHTSVRDEALGAVEDVLVTIEPGLGAHGSRVGA